MVFGEEVGINPNIGKKSQKIPNFCGAPLSPILATFTALGVSKTSC